MKIHGIAVALLTLACTGADVRPEWKVLASAEGVKRVRAEDGQPPVTVDADGVIALPAAGRPNCCWDFPMELDLSDAAFAEFDFVIDDITAFRNFQLYFRSGKGWYPIGLPVHQAIERRHVRVPVGGRYHEGTPAGWDRISGFRVRGYLIDGRTSRLSIANFRVIPKAEVADTPENRARQEAEKTANLGVSREWMAANLKPRPGERRLVWAHDAEGLKTGHKKYIGWDETVRRLKACGYTDLIVNLCWGATASYASKVLAKPQGDEFLCIYKDDQFELCKAACRKHGMKFHPWRVCYTTFWRSGRKEVDAFRKAGLLTLNSRLSEETGPWTATFCPSQPENQRREIDAMCELADKGCDGLHFDYIRYESGDYCFCPCCRELFAGASGRTFADWPADLQKNPQALAEWREWRRGNITRVVRAVHDYVKARYPRMEISVAARSSLAGSREGDGQDWVAWAKEGLVDFLCPMDYTPAAALFRNIYREQLKAVADSRVKFYPGIGMACWGKDDGGHLRRFGEEVAQLRADGLEGFTLFAVTKDTLPVLEEFPLR